MSTKAAATLLAGLLLAGCAEQSQPTSSTPVVTTPASAAPAQKADDAPCVPDALRRGAYAAAEAQLEALRGQRVTLQIEGTIAGKIDTMTVAVDPAQRRMALSDEAEGTDLRFDGALFSVETADARGHGRDENPAGAFRAAYDAFLAEVLDPAGKGPSFATDLTVDDYEVECVTLGGLQALTYTAQKDGQKSVVTIERNAPHRVLAGASVDPALGDNFRVKLSYEEVRVDVDTSLPRTPPTVAIDVVDHRTNERGGLYTSATIAGSTQWVDLSDITIQLVDEEGTVYYGAELRDGVYDMEDGDVFTFRDRDANGLLSPGDSFVMDVGPGLDVAFHDAWSRAIVDIQASA